MVTISNSAKWGMNVNKNFGDYPSRTFFFFVKIVHHEMIWDGFFPRNTVKNGIIETWKKILEPKFEDRQPRRLERW